MNTWHKVTEFEVTEDHLRLMRAANVRWLDIEYGAPGIDPKRPYRNSSVLEDLAEIINPEYKGMREGEALDWLDDNAERLERLHRETQTVLEIGLQTGRFEAGRFIRDDKYGAVWHAA